MAIAPDSKYLDRRSLARLAHMRFRTNHRVEGSYGGRHQSRQQGGAGEFVDFREYSGGEDLRRLDWKVLARTGKAFVRLHQEETNLVCTLAIDGSGSMDFAGITSTGNSKLQYAQYLATSLAYIIGLGQDQVGFAALGEKLVDYLPPGGSPQHLSHVIERIECLKTRPTVRSGPALRDLFERTTRRGVLMFLSDFLMEDLEETIAALRLFRHRGIEVIALHLVHPDEESLPREGSFQFVGLENEGALNCSPEEIWSAYHERFSAYLTMVRQMALAAGCDYRRVSTSLPYLDSLGEFLVERAG
ncbi:DUF58 domain-containing protein [Blastopirellula marina]|uniref:DUF58 domain-containing protein n=1 Tax=Blastopirellula marina TaxID=124 RepID=A0A2S8FA91_9BACT|nr:DUF58 domain-containing protein [Blastopirellula marina]PQO29059.1 hypothetical protein C5Y98_22910 [Blastopirellula marina]PTL42330.1 DUF58 domain-containing protein [Blastopirellula marina]